MTNDSSYAVRGLTAEGPSHDLEHNFRDSEPVTGSDEEPLGVSDLIGEYPSNRIIYLDEQAMRSIAGRLINDPNQFTKLHAWSGNDHVRLEVINDASAIDPVYFAQRIWRVPPGETIMDIPPLDTTTPFDELYPGAVVRVRAFLKTKEDLRPDRLTLTRAGKERVHAELANRGTLSINKAFLIGRPLYVVGQLRRLNPLVLTAAAVLLSQVLRLAAVHHRRRVSAG